MQRQICENQQVLRHCASHKAILEQEKRGDVNYLNMINQYEPRDMVQIRMTEERIWGLHANILRLEGEIYVCQQNIFYWEQHINLHLNYQ